MLQVVTDWVYTPNKIYKMDFAGPSEAKRQSRPVGLSILHICRISPSQGQHLRKNNILSTKRAFGLLAHPVPDTSPTENMPASRHTGILETLQAKSAFALLAGRDPRHGIRVLREVISRRGSREIREGGRILNRGNDRVVVALCGGFHQFGLCFLVVLLKAGGDFPNVENTLYSDL